MLDTALCSYDETTPHETVIEDEIRENANTVDLDFEQTDSETPEMSFTTETVPGEEEFPNF